MAKFNLKGVPKSVWARVVATLLVWLNLVSISFFGFELIPFADTEIYEGVSYALTFIVTIWSGYKNNDFTEIAQEKTKEVQAFKEANK